MEKRRPTLGFFVSELENAYAQTLCRGITDAAAAADANVIIFPGKSPKAPYDYQYQYNAIYELASENSLDALILATGTMINFLNEDEFKAFYKRYDKIPLVSISIELEGGAGVLIDNKVGLRSVLEHLIVEHKFDRIAFINGPENNTEARERYSVYREALEAHGLEFDPDLVADGDFTKFSGVQAINTFLDNRQVTFKALAAANDEMALSAMTELQKRGFRVPEDVAVVGFDNVESAHYSSPSLTTVAQPIYDQAYSAVRLACELIEGKPAHNITLPTSMVLRESCGCLSRAVTSVNAAGGSAAADVGAGISSERDRDTEDVVDVLQRALTQAAAGALDDAAGMALINEISAVVNTIVKDKEEKLRFWQDVITDFRTRANLGDFNTDTVIRLEDFFHRARMLLLETSFKNDSKRWTIHHNDIRGLRDVLSLMVSDVNNSKDALRSILPLLKEMGLRSFYVFLYEKAVIHKITTDWTFPDQITLTISYSDMMGFADLSGITMPVTSILDRTMYPKEERYVLVTSPLFYMNEQIGFLVCEPNLNDIYLFESLVVEISCALKLAALMKARQGIENRLRTALEELEKYNEQLSNISETDELTKLLNRRGFLNRARHMLSVARRMKRDGTFFFADLDGLKKINDTYGHEEGDNAIKTVAAILSKAFRESDVLARLGGDEFTIFTLNTTTDMLDTFERRIAAYVDEYNQISKKSYNVSVSVGAVPFRHTDVTDIESLMNQADILLYEKKKQKKKAMRQ
jgi:diguanylate cyclase (GGDEF)-like protein